MSLDSVKFRYIIKLMPKAYFWYVCATLHMITNRMQTSDHLIGLSLSDGVGQYARGDAAGAVW
jgi:hypothetical protein